MRIKNKLIAVYLGIALLFSVTGYLGVHYTTKIGALFENVEAVSVPSLSSLMEMIAATRQASIKAVEFYLRGNAKDKKKSINALEKVEESFRAYQAVLVDKNSAEARLLETKMQTFIKVIHSYLSLGAAPLRSRFIEEVTDLHETRSSLIQEINDALQVEPISVEPVLRRMKSEARKISIKSVEFVVNGRAKDKAKAEQAIHEITSQLNVYKKHSQADAVLKKRVISGAGIYLHTAREYLENTSRREVSARDLQNKEREVHQTRRTLIHALYPLIERERKELAKASSETRTTITNASNVILGLIILGVGVALLSGILLGKSISTRLKQLNDAAHQIAGGDLDKILLIHSRDEIGELATSFDHMREELKLHREHMDDLVKKRTVALENSNKELESYSYSIAHDLRSPLRSITGFSQILLEDAKDKLDESDSGYLERIITASKRMSELIDDILELSRVSRTNMQADKIDLGELCVEISETLNTSDPERKVDWSIQPDLKATADRNLIYLVLSNLLSNAWKFTSEKENAIIEVGKKQENGETIFYVRDNGIGFDMNYVDKIFGLFQRLHKINEYEGTGVGLATVQRIIDRHGGWVKAEGELGQGATIYFSLSTV